MTILASLQLYLTLMHIILFWGYTKKELLA